jgi:cytochrome c biogenesis protein ResB
VWRLATSDGLLAAALIVLAGLLSLSALLPQTPQNDPVAYSRWLSETQQQFGSLTSPFINLGLFSITGSIVFRLALGALAFCCAVRLLDQIDQLRAISAVPDQPSHPIVDQTLEVDLATAQAQLRGYRFRSHDEVIIADRFIRRSIISALMVYGGALIVLLGLVLGSFADTRADNLALDASQMTAVGSTPYALRLDSLAEDHAAIALLNQTETIAQGNIAYKQPFIGSGLAVYLNNIGPALIISATSHTSGTLGLQSTATEPLQPQKLIDFTSDRSEGFVAAPGIGVVLRIAIVNPDQYNVQAYQSASGNILTSGAIAPGSTLVVSDTVFSFQPSAFITVSAVQQPSHWLIMPAWIITLIGLIGLLLWQPRRVWLQGVDNQTRVTSDDASFNPSHLSPANEPARRLSPHWLVVSIWIVWTALLAALVISIYPRAASLDQPDWHFNAVLGAWLVFSGSVIARRSITRLILIVLGLIVALLSLILRQNIR